MTLPLINNVSTTREVNWMYKIHEFGCQQTPQFLPVNKNRHQRS